MPESLEFVSKHFWQPCLWSSSGTPSSSVWELPSLVLFLPLSVESVILNTNNKLQPPPRLRIRDNSTSAFLAWPPSCAARPRLDRTNWLYEAWEHKQSMSHSRNSHVQNKTFKGANEVRLRLSGCRYEIHAVSACHVTWFNKHLSLFRSTFLFRVTVTSSVLIKKFPLRSLRAQAINDPFTKLTLKRKHSKRQMTCDFDFYWKQVWDTCSFACYVTWLSKRFSSLKNRSFTLHVYVSRHVISCHVILFSSFWGEQKQEMLRRIFLLNFIGC